MVAVDDPVEVLGDPSSHPVQLFVVETLRLEVREAREGDGGQVADGDLVLGGVLHDLGAEVGTLDGAQVLLVRLAVAGVLVDHVGRAGLDLGVDDGVPEHLGLDGPPSPAVSLVLLIEPLELLAPAVGESGALVGTHEGPIAVGLDSLHEQVGDPEGVEKVPRPLLLLAVVLPELEELLDILVPGFEVDGEGSLPLAASLIAVAGRVVEDSEHGDEAVGLAVGASDVTILSPDVVDS
mmetsp:Transcript_5519/g.9404  ORF Transcript_5519/g.9404 Transcript_5519/m.9404 type:complete len:237 (-) Transcript_5519:794-1504(-)